MRLELFSDTGNQLLEGNPLLGTVRRSMGFPVLVDEIRDMQSTRKVPEKTIKADSGDSDEPDSDSTGRDIPNIDF